MNAGARPLEKVPTFEKVTWLADAACRGTDPNLFYPDAEDKKVHAALELCAVCPVQGECLAYAFATPVQHDHGVWGGMKEGERFRLRHWRHRDEKAFAVLIAFERGQKLRQDVAS